MKHYRHSKRLIINLIGPTGSGKGTHGKDLSRLLKLPHISLGDIFRKELSSLSEVGKLIQYHFSQSKNLIANEVIYGMLVKRISMEDCKNGFIIDGFPATPIQSEVLFTSVLREIDVYIPIVLSISDKDADLRLSKRYVCSKCEYQTSISEVKSERLCPNCFLPFLIRREDDDLVAEIRQKRHIFYAYLQKICKIISQYTSIVTIEQDHLSTKEEIFGTIKEKIKAYGVKI